MATTITGRVTFTPTEMTFQNAKSLSLTRDGQMLFRPEAKKKKVIADVYKVTPPNDPALESGNKLCKGKPIAYLLVWKSEKTGTETDPRTLAPFSGQKLNSGSPDDCGRYTYDAGPPWSGLLGEASGGYDFLPWRIKLLLQGERPTFVRADVRPIPVTDPPALRSSSTAAETAARDHDLGTLRPERTGDREADAAGAAGDEDALSLKFHDRRPYAAGG
jgi:hypothetical protein